MRRLAVLALAALAAGAPASRAAAPAPSCDDFRQVLSAFVDARGLVDYRGLRGHRAALDRFVARLARVDPDAYSAWSEADRVAFWINAYNALTLRAIIDHDPVDSIRKIPGIWDQLTFTVLGEPTTLQEIEDERLRKGFREPRIHVALVCAAVSCPKLRNEPYDGAHLDAQLDDQARAFLSDPRHFHIDRATHSVRVSEIFRWYAEDFAPGALPAGDAREDLGVRRFAAPYLNESDRAFVREARIEYAPYDWALNERPR
jgi:hypothetical protein